MDFIDLGNNELCMRKKGLRMLPQLVANLFSGFKVWEGYICNPTIHKERKPKPLNS